MSTACRTKNEHTRGKQSPPTRLANPRQHAEELYAARQHKKLTFSATWDGEVYSVPNNRTRHLIKTTTQ